MPRYLPKEHPLEEQEREEIGREGSKREAFPGTSRKSIHKRSREKGDIVLVMHITAVVRFVKVA